MSTNQQTEPPTWLRIDHEAGTLVLLPDGSQHVRATLAVVLGEAKSGKDTSITDRYNLRAAQYGKPKITTDTETGTMSLNVSATYLALDGLLLFGDVYRQKSIDPSVNLGISSSEAAESADDVKREVNSLTAALGALLINEGVNPSP